MCALPIGPPARLHEYSLKQLSLDEDTLDGPFFMSNGQFGLLVSLRGKDGGALPSCSELRWSRDLPPAARSAPLQIFVRQKNGMLALGPAQIARRGQLTRDGYKVALAFAEPLPAALWSHLVEAALRPLAPAPEELIATLTTSSTTSERIAAMRMFAARWFNCPADAQPLAHELPLPLPLRTLYALVAEHPVDAQNQLVAATALVVEDDRIAFYIENQGVCSWATSVAADDPPVYVRYNDGAAGWQREADSISEFLIQMLLLEANFAAPFGANHDEVPKTQLTRLVNRIGALPLSPWRASGTRFFGGNGIIGMALPNGAAFDVWIGAKERERLAPIERLVAAWSNVNF